MDNIYKYKLFLKTIETGNITRTAEAFFVSQSAVSQQLKQLEEYFGKPLFYKDKTLKLTPFGHSIQGEIKQLITYYANKENFIRKLSDTDDTSIAVFGKTAFLLTLVNQFIEEHPIPIRSIKNANNYDICRAIKSGEAHVGFGEKENDFDTLSYTKILDIPIVLIVHKDHVLAKNKSITIDELVEEPLILYDDATFIGEKLQEQFIIHDTYPRNVLRSNHSNIIKMMVEKNYGLGFVYKHTTKKRKEELYKIIPVENLNISKPYYMITNREFLSDRQTMYIDMIKTFFKSNKRKLLS
jgi:DNA-binding transcriptional LysR family regulator